jgi:hypothetical protein
MNKRGQPKQPPQDGTVHPEKARPEQALPDEKRSRVEPGTGPDTRTGLDRDGNEQQPELHQVPLDARHDQQLAEDVRERLERAPELDAGDVKVQVTSGIVTLRGAIESREMKQAAAEVAERVPGVQHVLNELHVPRPIERLAAAASKLL